MQKTTSCCSSRLSCIVFDKTNYCYKQQEFQTIEQPSKSRSLEVIVSDMTAFYVKGKHYELTLYTDVSTK